jgi:hypothetical protein
MAWSTVIWMYLIVLYPRALRFEFRAHDKSGPRVAEGLSYEEFDAPTRSDGVAPRVPRDQRVSMKMFLCLLMLACSSYAYRTRTCSPSVILNSSNALTLWFSWLLAERHLIAPGGGVKVAQVPTSSNYVGSRRAPCGFPACC